MAFEPFDGADRFAPSVVLDRRRPDRRNELRPELIPLLRGKSDSDARPEEIAWASDDPWSSAWGLILELVIYIIPLGMVGLGLWLALE
jgi:hypothetical protein